MTVLTNKEYAQQDEFDNLWETHKDDARTAFWAAATKLTLSVEHLIPSNIEGEAVYKVDKRVADVVDKVKQLGIEFTYTVDFEGRFKDYKKDFDYDFSKEAKEHLSDDLSYYVE